MNADQVDALITRLQEALAAAEVRETAKDKQIAELTAALRNVRGYMADVAVAGMLIGADQAETHTRVSAHGIAMLKIVDAAISSSLPNKEDRNG